MTGPEQEAAPEAEAQGGEPASSVLGELEVLADDMKETVAGTPAQRVRVLLLVVVIGIIMLLAFAAMRASGNLAVLVL